MDINMSFYTAASFIVSPLIRIVFRVKRVGLENLPREGKLVICSNHRSNYDPVIVGGSLNRDLKYMAKAELFKNPFLSGLIRAFGAFPVNRGRNDTDAIKKAIKILEQDYALLMFPEGHRQKNGDVLQHFKSGAALFSFKTHSDVIPVAIVTDGDVKIFKRNIVIIGKPIKYDELGFTDGSTENLRAVSLLLQNKVSDLITTGKTLWK